MSSASSYDPELIDQTRQQIRGLVHEIEGLSRSELSPAEFYEGLLNRVVAALAAAGGAVWELDESGRLNLAYQINLQQTRLTENQENQQQHGQLLHKVVSEGQGTLVAPHSGAGDEEAANPSEFLLVLALLKSDKEVQGVVEIFQRPGGRPTVERGYLRFLMQMCDLAGDYLKTRRLRLYTDRQLMWSQLEQFTRLVHQSLDPRETAYTVANEGRRLIACDRVSVALRKGSRYRIEAVSGQETFDSRSNTVTMLGELATIVVAGGEDLWYTGDTGNLPPQIEETVEAYVDESHSKLVAVLPLARPREEGDDQTPPEYVGALIVEQITESALPESMRRRIDVVAEHSSLAIANSREHQDLFLMPVWRAIGKSRWVVQARTLPKTLLIVATCLAALLMLFIIPASFDLQGRGTLEPVTKQDVFAGVDGVVEKVDVEHGQMVKKGQVLIELRNTDLDVAITDTIGKLQATKAERGSALQSLFSDSHLAQEDKARLEGQILEYTKTEESLADQLKLLGIKKEQLKVVSPIDGQVLTWQVSDRLLHRPVEKGQTLVTVANPTGEWELEIHMPEDRMGHILRARNELAPGKELTVSYILATNPGTRHVGTVKEIRPFAEVQGEEGNVVLMRVTIDKSEYNAADVRPGASVTAKVHCGWAPVGYVWFHDLISFVQSRILFRL